MAPIDDYRWSLRYMQRIFQICGQGILAGKYHRGIMMYFILFNWIFVAISLISTTFDYDHYDNTVRFITGSFLCGAIQVNFYTFR